MAPFHRGSNGTYPAAISDADEWNGDSRQTSHTGSTVSPSLAAAIINGKYVNAVPLYRLEQEFTRYGLAISRQNLANWCIRLGEEYLAILYDYLKKELYECPVIHLTFLSAQLYIKTILKKNYPTFLFLAERLFKVFKIFYNLIFICLIYQFLYRTVLKPLTMIIDMY